MVRTDSAEEESISMTDLSNFLRLLKGGIELIDPQSLAGLCVETGGRT
jgi:hypothetical protein